MFSEASGSAGSSRRSEMNRTNVARASLNGERLKDCKSFPSRLGLRVWHKDAAKGIAMRELYS